MRKYGNFHVRIGIAYSLFFVLLTLVFGLIFYSYNSKIYEKNALKNTTDISNKIVIQLENAVEYMDFVSLDCISRPEFIRALRELKLLNRDFKDNLRYLSNIYSEVNNSIIRASIIRSALRLNVFNAYGDFFTSYYDTKENKASALEKINQLSWVNSARQADGEKIIIPPYQDPWANKNPTKVFSLIRMVRDPGNEVGFIEVQSPVTILEEICNFNNQFDVILYDNEQNLVYSTMDIGEQLFSYYMGLITNAKDNAFIQKNPINNKKEIISHSFSDYLNWTIVIIQDRAKALQPLAFTRNTMFYVVIFLMAISILLSYTIARKLTFPIRELREHIEQIDIQNIPKDLKISSEGINEIESLNQSFKTMLNRLSMAMEQEIESRSLRLKSHFDLLQAQINPHFIYNMFNIIANVGLEAGVDEVADICRKVSEMLRFSTSNVDKTTNIIDEVNHVSNYLFLMKKRFEHKLEYVLDIDNSILDIQVPKLILQPLVENSIYHGFNNSQGIMRILIKGTVIDGNWRIDIIDNGSGFNQSVLENLQQKIKTYENQIYNNTDSLGLSIGGMGIINIYIRLRLFFNRENRFEFGNNKTGGAFISIGGRIKNNIAKDDNYVQNINS